MNMSKDDIHPLRTGSAFFSRVLLGIRRLAALTRSPVPIAWMADLSAVGLAKAEGPVRGKSQNPVKGRGPTGLYALGRRMLDVVGRWFVVVGAWMSGSGRLNCSRPALAGHCAGRSSRLHRSRPYVKIRGTSRY